MIFRRNRCPHEHIRGIYGDEINLVGGFRLQCLICNRLLDGPAGSANCEEVVEGRVSRPGDDFFWVDGRAFVALPDGGDL